MSFEKCNPLALTAERENQLPPEWAKVPVVAGMIGIKRSRFYELIEEAKGEIKTIVLKSPGSKKGSRIVQISSVLRYLNKLAVEQGGKVNESRA
jgi:hypothetical protein